MTRAGQTAGTNVVALPGTIPGGVDLARFLAGQGSAGLDLPAGLTAEDWDALGAMLGQIGNAQPWWVGDWIVYRLWVVENGKRVRRDLAALAEEAKERTGLTPGYLKRVAGVAETFPRQNRRASLSWFVHYVVAPIKDDAGQKALLDWAEEPTREGRLPRSAAAVTRHGRSLGLIPVRESRRLRPVLPVLDKKTEGAVRDLERWINQGHQLLAFFKGGATAAKAARACETWITPDHAAPLVEFLAVIEDTLRNRGLAA